MKISDILKYTPTYIETQRFVSSLIRLFLKRASIGQLSSFSSSGIKISLRSVLASLNLAALICSINWAIYNCTRLYGWEDSSTTMNISPILTSEATVHSKIPPSTQFIPGCWEVTRVSSISRILRYLEICRNTWENWMIWSFSCWKRDMSEAASTLRNWRMQTKTIGLVYSWVTIRLQELFTST